MFTSDGTRILLVCDSCIHKVICPHISRYREITKNALDATEGSEDMFKTTITCNHYRQDIPVPKGDDGFCKKKLPVIIEKEGWPSLQCFEEDPLK